MGYSKYNYYPIEHYGITSGNQPIQLLPSAIGTSLYITYYAMNNNRVSLDSMHSIKNKALKGADSSQIKYLSDQKDIHILCAQSLSGTSRCYCGVQWNDLNPSTNLYNSTIRGNWGINEVDDTSSNSDIDRFILPLQLAIDNLIRNASLSVNSVPYMSRSDKFNFIRRNPVPMLLSNDWLTPAMYIILIGAAYHLSGTIARDRDRAY